MSADWSSIIAYHAILIRCDVCGSCQAGRLCEFGESQRHLYQILPGHLRFLTPDELASGLLECGTDNLDIMLVILRKQD
jgi:hypothetical protein